MPKVKWQGEEVEGLEVRFKSVREDWNEYDLEDGSTIRVKLVVSDVIRLNDKYDQEDNPIYVVKSGNMVIVKSPDHLKKKTQFDVGRQ